MKLITLVAPCHFGMEAVLKREIEDLGYEIYDVDDGRVRFQADMQGIVLANIFLRTAERILWQVDSFVAETFEELFEKTRAIPWEDILPRDARFWVAKAASVKSKLFSPSDIQSIMKKAMVERLKSVYHTDWFEESGAPFPLRVMIKKDEVLVCLDTTGTSLHKRGYRLQGSQAPISETLAAALIQLTPWRGDRILVDPFCGSGTFPIEAAMMAADIAPGMNRDFTAMSWEHLVGKVLWDDGREEAKDLVRTDVETDLQGYDIDPRVLAHARENAKRAGVDHLIHFQQREVKDLSHHGKYGFIITNPPYGERIGEADELAKIYGELGAAFAALDTWSAYVITAYDKIERDFHRKADKNRKIYNGMIKTYFYQFLGPKPPARRTSRKDGDV